MCGRTTHIDTAFLSVKLPYRIRFLSHQRNIERERGEKTTFDDQESKKGKNRKYEKDIKNKIMNPGKGL